MKSFTITIQPCREPVTITVHADEEPVVMPPESEASIKPYKLGLPAENDDESLLRYLTQRAKMYFDEMGGFVKRSNFTTRFQNDARITSVKNQILVQLGVVIFKVVLPHGGRPTHFYVLPEFVAEFKKQIKNEGMCIVE